MSEGLSPIYRNGVITPGTRGLGPIKQQKPIQVPQSTPKINNKPIRRINFKNLV